MPSTDAVLKGAGYFWGSVLVGCWGYKAYLGYQSGEGYPQRHRPVADWLKPQKTPNSTTTSTSAAANQKLNN